MFSHLTIPDGAVVVGGKVIASVVVGGKVGAIVDDTKSNKVSKVKTKQNMSFLEYLVFHRDIITRFCDVYSDLPDLPLPMPPNSPLILHVRFSQQSP